MKPYWKKFQEAQYNLRELKVNFAKKEPSFKHCLNNFLSSAQSVFWTLNKEFNKKDQYNTWQEARGSRLPKNSVLFKELRNVSLKEGPIEHAGIINDFDFGAAGITIPPFAEVFTPWIETKTGKLQSDIAQIKTVDGEIYEVRPLIIHDFCINLISDNKLIEIKTFLHDADNYLASIKKEIIEAENKFN